ncbi:LysR family transcriptional regulator [Bacillus sp. FSL K6-0047]
MPTLAQYKAFRTLIETGSFTETGIKLNLTQSSISHAISKLEDEFELTLIIRNRSNINLTNEGKLVYEQIVNILQQHEQLLTTISTSKNIISGVLRIGTLPSVSLILLPKVLAYVEEHYPQLDIQLFEGNYDQVEEWLETDQIDVGFLARPHASGFVFEQTFKDNLVCILSKDHPLAEEIDLNINQLKNERWIMPNKQIDRDVARILSENNIKPNIVYEIAVDQVILAMVSENLGISITPSSLLIHSPNNLIQKNFSTPYIREVGIAYKHRVHSSPITLKFIDIVKQIASSNINNCLK